MYENNMLSMCVRERQEIFEQIPKKYLLFSVLFIIIKQTCVSLITQVIRSGANKFSSTKTSNILVKKRSAFC